MADSSEKLPEMTTETSNVLRKDKLPLEDLSREDLLKQVKRYLGLLQTAKKKYSELSSKCCNLEKEQDVVSELLGNLKSKNHVNSIEELQDKIDKLQEITQQSQSVMSEETASLQKELTNLNQEKGNLLKQSRETEEQIQCMQMQLDTLRVTCQCLQEDVLKLSTENKELKNEVLVLTDARDTALQTIKLKSQAQIKEVEMFKNKQAELEKKLSVALETKREAADDTCSILECANNEITKQLNDVLDENQFLKKSLDEIKCEKNILCEKNELLSSVEERYSELEKICNSLREQVEHLDIQYNNLKEENKLLQQTYLNTCEENENLKMKFLGFQNVNHDLLEAHEKFDSIQTLKTELEQNLMHIQEQNSNLVRNNQELQNELSSLKLKEKEVSENLNTCMQEKDFIFSEMKNVLKGMSIIDTKISLENASFMEMLVAISEGYKELQTKAFVVEKNLTDMSVKCQEYEENITILSGKLENIVQENTALKLKIEDNSEIAVKNECLDKEKSQLLMDNSLLIEKHHTALKEIETLKQQLDEYENDIQKHLNLEKENFQLQDMLKELEKENERLSETYESKCIDLDELMVHIFSLIVSIKRELCEYEISDADDFQPKNNSFQNIFVLKSLCSDICSRLCNSSEKMKNLELELEESLKTKQNIYNELIQIQDLKQFLEDEVKELREETEQLKLESKSQDKVCSDCHDSQDQRPVSGTRGETLTLKDVFVQTCVSKSDVATDIDNSAIQSMAQISSPSKLQQENSYSNDAAYISEWGCASDPFPTSADVNDTVENLRRENEHLTSLLETKSSLVEKIHCEVDLLLSKIEDLSSEKEEKESDLEAAHALNANLQKQVKDLNNVVCRMQMAFKKVATFISLVKEIKENVPQTLQEFMLYWQNDLSNTKQIVYDIQSRYSSCCLIIEKYEVENTKVRNENSYLRECVLQLSEAVATALQSFEANKERANILDSWKETVLQENVTKVFDVDETINNSMEKLISNVNLLNTEFKNMVDYIVKLPAVRSEGLSSCSHSNISDPEKQVDSMAKQCDNRSVCSEKSAGHSLVAEEQNCSLCDQLRNQLSGVETKMGKFKAVAIKLKKELSESKQNCQNLSEEREKLKLKISELSHELSSTSITHRQHVQNFQNLQIEYDKLQDESERAKSEAKSFQTDLASTLSELNNYRQKFKDMESEVKKAQEHLALSELEKSDLGSKITDLESKLIIMESKNSESYAKIQGLVDDLAKSQKEATDLAKDKEQLSKSLEDALKEGKQHSLLDLEMADYERTISELTDQLEKKTIEINELRSEVEAKVSRVQVLEEEMKFCESHRQTEEARAEGFKETLENSKKELTLLRDCKFALEEDVAKMNFKVETLGLQEAEYKSQLSQKSAELEKMKEMLKSSGENHQRIVQSLNSKIASQKEDILVAHKEVESVKQDFENYKIRVHSVFKQQKQIAPFSNSDSEVKEKLESENEKMKLQLKDLSEKLLAMNLESESLREEHEHLLQRHDKIVEELEAKDQNWRLRLEQMNEEKNRLQTLLENLSSEHSLKSEMLASTYKKQMKLMQKDHKQVVEDLQKQLESADVEIARLQRELQKNNSAAIANFNQEDNFAFDILSQERQEGEGSECTDDRSTPIRHLSLATIPTTGFLPLEKLLQSPDESHTPTSLVSNQDSERLSNELNASWKKIDHLTELLNESEANNLRWSEQVRVLKEEVRRLERNKQREEHAKNLEYLKNVFIKFATLQSGSEKARLVPVLNTLLKLSPTEHQQLKEAAGESGESDATASGWGNYLHRWSGLV